jgi:sulfur relay (sulfurtransferase) complex TusBCD TusD component (DsrE family)
MRLSVMVLGDPANSQALRLAARMLEIAGEAGATLDTLFLYHKGAYAALNPHAADPLIERLGVLASSTGLDCVVCRTALARAGVEGQPLSAPFRLGGLTDWLGAFERADRVLHFGNPRA